MSASDTSGHALTDQTISGRPSEADIVIYECTPWYSPSFPGGAEVVPPEWRLVRYLLRSTAKLIQRKSRRRDQDYPSRKTSISDAREDAMSNAGNALLWTVLYFALSFVAIFVVWFADRLRSNFLGKR